MIILRLDDFEGVDFFYENDEGHIFIHTFHGWKRSSDIPDRMWLDHYVEMFDDATLTEIDIDAADMVEELKKL